MVLISFIQNLSISHFFFVVNLYHLSMHIQRRPTWYSPHRANHTRIKEIYINETLSKFKINPRSTCISINWHLIKLYTYLFTYSIKLRKPLKCQLKTMSKNINLVDMILENHHKEFLIFIKIDKLNEQIIGNV